MRHHRDRTPQPPGLLGDDEGLVGEHVQRDREHTVLRTDYGRSNFTVVVVPSADTL